MTKKNLTDEQLEAMGRVRNADSPGNTGKKRELCIAVRHCRGQRRRRLLCALQGLAMVRSAGEMIAKDNISPEFVS